jgi:hypothetical protein
MSGGSPPRIEILERKRPGLAHSGSQEIARSARVKVRINAQSGMSIGDGGFSGFALAS